MPTLRFHADQYPGLQQAKAAGVQVQIAPPARGKCTAYTECIWAAGRLGKIAGEPAAIYGQWRIKLFLK